LGGILVGFRRLWRVCRDGEGEVAIEREIEHMERFILIDIYGWTEFMVR
jgi:hypothetical protein